MSIYSSKNQLNKIKDTLEKYLRLPFSDKTIPGSVMESALAYVREAEKLNTYDFVDVVDTNNKVGWQVKSTKSTTPVTWKRAKIPNADRLIRESEESEAGLQNLGNTIIEFCNSHAKQSIELYKLEKIGYARIIIFEDGRICYFERLLCTRNNPIIFNENDYIWKWSTQKKIAKKEQFSALHGINIHTKNKCWAWHGRGENQLHFSGEKEWWPQDDTHTITFNFPSESEKISLEDFFRLLGEADMPS